MEFENVSCSECGEDFGPGDHGYSHCEDHGKEQEAYKTCDYRKGLYCKKIKEEVSFHLNEWCWLYRPRRNQHD